MPILIAAYIISFLDRTNIGMAKDRLEIDLGITAAAYGLGAGLFFVAYALMEIPSNLIMHKVGARIWITRIMITWGIISGGMAFVQNDVQFYIMRILLGAAEAGLFPGVLLYLTYWFGRDVRTRAMAYFLVGACAASVLGGPLGGLLLQMDGIGGYHGWQWMFVVEALPAVLLAFVVWKVLPDRPSDAKWLTAAEAAEIETRLAKEQADGTAHSGTHSFGAIFKDRAIMLVIYIYLAHQIAVYSVTYFLPSVIAANGVASPVLIGLLAGIPWFFGAVGAIFISPLASNPVRSRKLLTGGLILMISGLAIGALGGSVVGLIGFGLSGLAWFVVQPILFNVTGTRLSGITLAAGLALMNTIGITGGFFGPSVMGATEQATGNPLSGLWFAVGLLVLGLLSVPLINLKNSGDVAREATAAAEAETAAKRAELSK
ncbi:MFS transporter [Crystallibacter degradans]|uniref:MFS transporter n=1 Tax=Crystallibacter degradans TaxID=2726743 RepID=UPI001F0EEA8A|nr:MFS transporter [Arthrobacter sp. SF27]